jgi:excisionase family DNA binding protein
MHNYVGFGQPLSNRTITALRFRSVDRAAGADFPPVLTAAMAAELLQVNVEYLRRMVREGRIPCHRFPGGRELRFLRDELLAWLATLPGEDQSASSGRTHHKDPVGT